MKPPLKLLTALLLAPLAAHTQPSNNSTAAKRVGTIESYDPRKGFSLEVRLPVELEPSGSVIGEMKGADGEPLVRLRVDEEQLTLAAWSQPPPQEKINQLKAKHSKTGGDLVERAIQGRQDLAIPLAMLAKSTERRLTLVATSARLSLYLDGILVDEEWPLGLRSPKAPVSLMASDGLTAAFSMATPGSAEVAQRLGDSARVTDNWTRFLGETGSAPPYFRPFGINTHAGDSMPFYHAGRWHVFYLFDRRNFQSKFGYGGFEWGHISTTDLLNWEEHPTALRNTVPWDDMWTGSVIHNGEEYLAFNKGPYIGISGSKENAGNGVRVARSKDGFNFVRDPNPLENVLPFGDPDVFRMDDGRYGMLSRGDEKRQRKIAFHTSPDLKTWQREERSPFAFAPDNCDCPHYFRFQGTHYLFASKVARQAEALNGPWIDIPKSTLGVPKTAEWKNGRRLIAGTISDGGWGGDSVLHELVQLPGKRLGEKFVDELTPLRGTPAKVDIVPLFGTSQPGEDRVVVDGAAGFAAVAIDGVPAQARVRISVSASPDCKRFGLGVRGKGAYAAGSVLSFDPAGRTAAFGTILGRNKHNETREIKEVSALNQPIALDLILGPNGIVDLEINRERCLTGRGSPSADFRRLFLFSDGGQVRFEKIEVRPWEPIATVKPHLPSE